MIPEVDLKRLAAINKTSKELIGSILALSCRNQRNYVHAQ